VIYTYIAHVWEEFNHFNVLQCFKINITWFSRQTILTVKLNWNVRDTNV